MSRVREKNQVPDQSLLHTVYVKAVLAFSKKVTFLTQLGASTHNVTSVRSGFNYCPFGVGSIILSSQVKEHYKFMGLKEGTKPAFLLETGLRDPAHMIHTQVPLMLKSSISI